MKPIILIGFKSSGKSLLGGELAKRISASFVDLDVEIERMYGKGLRCREIVTREGEEFFRKLETDALTKVLGANIPLVLALGGGAVGAVENQKLIENCFKIHIVVEKNLLFLRMMKGGRPTFFGEKGTDREIFEKLYREREPLYLKLADATVENSGEPREAINELVASIQKL